MREDGNGGWEEGATSVRGVHDLAAVLQPRMPEGELAGAQEGLQEELCRDCIRVYAGCLQIRAGFKGTKEQSQG